MKESKTHYHRAQSVTEYAVLVALVAAALLTMQVYIKRGVQGRLRDLANQISPLQYERGNTAASYTTTRSSDISESQQRLNYTRRINSDITSRRGVEITVGND